MTKKTRNPLTELLSEFKFDDLAPEPIEKPKPRSRQQSSTKASKKQSQAAQGLNSRNYKFTAK
jgi:hypothetical protein